MRSTEILELGGATLPHVVRDQSFQASTGGHLAFAPGLTGYVGLNPWPGYDDLVDAIKNGNFEMVELLLKAYRYRFGLRWGWEVDLNQIYVRRLLRLAWHWRSFFDYMLVVYKDLYFWLTLLGYEDRLNEGERLRAWVLKMRRLRGWIEYWMGIWAEFEELFYRWVSTGVEPDEWPQLPPTDVWPLPWPPFLRPPPDLRPGPK